jgi:hypothetical protein
MTYRRLLFPLIAATAFLPAAKAQANILEFLFPSFKEQYDPYITMRAPWANTPETQPIDPSQITRESILASIPQPSEIVPLHLPHTTTFNVRNWVTTAVSDALTFEGQNLPLEFQNAQLYFDEAGRAQFKDFITSSGMKEALNTGKTRIQSVITDPPMLLSKKAGPDGRFRWLLEVPVLVTYLDSANPYYSQGAVPTNYEGILTVQIVRARSEDQSEHDVLIELLRGSIKKTS